MLNQSRSTMWFTFIVFIINYKLYEIKISLFPLMSQDFEKKDNLVGRFHDIVCWSKKQRWKWVTKNEQFFHELENKKYKS